MLRSLDCCEPRGLAPSRPQQSHNVCYDLSTEIIDEVPSCRTHQKSCRATYIPWQRMRVRPRRAGEQGVQRRFRALRFLSVTTFQSSFASACHRSPVTFCASMHVFCQRSCAHSECAPGNFWAVQLVKSLDHLGARRRKRCIRATGSTAIRRCNQEHWSSARISGNRRRL